MQSYNGHVEQIVQHVWKTQLLYFIPDMLKTRTYNQKNKSENNQTVLAQFIHLQGVEAVL